MSTAVFDIGLQLQAPGAALVATGNGTGVLLYPRDLLTCDVVAYASGVVATGTYTIAVAVSDVVGGTYTRIASVVWPPALAAGRIHFPINADLAGFLDADSRYIRAEWTIGGTTPGIVLGVFLARAANKMGAAYRVGDFITVS